MSLHSRRHIKFEVNFQQLILIQKQDEWWWENLLETEKHEKRSLKNQYRWNIKKTKVITILDHYRWKNICIQVWHQNKKKIIAFEHPRRKNICIQAWHQNEKCRWNIHLSWDTSIRTEESGKRKYIRYTIIKNWSYLRYSCLGFIRNYLVVIIFT